CGIGSEADARLVAQRVVRKDPAVLDHLEEWQHEVARDPEDFAGAVVLQGLQQGRREHGATWLICRANAIGSGSDRCTGAQRAPCCCGSDPVVAKPCGTWTLGSADSPHATFARFPE